MIRIYKLNTYQYSVFTKRKQPRYVTVQSYSKVDVCTERRTNYIYRWLIGILKLHNFIVRSNIYLQSVPFEFLESKWTYLT